MGRNARCRFSARYLRQGPRAKFQQCLPLGTAPGQDERGATSHRNKRSSDSISLSELCADCACILGRSVGEVASSLSLPEAFLILRRDQARRLEELRWNTQSRGLATSSVWSKPAAQALNRFEKSLRVDKRQERRGEPQDFGRLYQSVGVPVKPM